MKISEAIVQLQDALAKYGDLDFCHGWTGLPVNIRSIDIESTFEDDPDDEDKIIVTAYIVIY